MRHKVLPTRDPHLSHIANVAIMFMAMAEHLALEDRKLVRHRGGRAESVAEHSFSLSIVAPELASVLYPNLNRDTVIRFTRIHDILEVYTGDIDTHNFAAVDTAQKEANEVLALQKLKKDFAAFPAFIQDVEDYEAQNIPETRFVRVADKLMPLLIHVHDHGATVASYADGAIMLADAEHRQKDLLKNYPEFGELIALRLELTHYVAGLIEPKSQ